MSEMKTLKFPGDTKPREIVDAKAREDISKLSESGLPSGGAPYQQLVTDGTGKAKWQDRLCYAECKPFETIYNPYIFDDNMDGYVKISDTFISKDDIIGAVFWRNDGYHTTVYASEVENADPENDGYYDLSAAGYTDSCRIVLNDCEIDGKTYTQGIWLKSYNYIYRIEPRSEIVKLQSEYLAEYLYGYSFGKIDAIKQATYQFDTYGAFNTYSCCSEDGELIAGGSSIVSFDNKSYVVENKGSGNDIIIGDFLENGPDFSRYPFFITAQSDDYGEQRIVIFANSPGKHKLRISGFGRFANPIEPQFAPDIIPKYVVDGTIISHDDVEASPKELYDAFAKGMLYLTYSDEDEMIHAVTGLAYKISGTGKIIGVKVYDSYKNTNYIVGEFTE